MNTWSDFEDGKTIGAKGSEEGIIILDLEYDGGARITLEENARPDEKGESIPFAITFGIYGLMFHTHYESIFELVNERISQTKLKIEAIFELYEIDEAKRDTTWYQAHNKIMDALVEMHQYKYDPGSGKISIA